MNRRATIQVCAAIAMFGLAGVFALSSWRASHRGPQAFFYDLSKRQLFAADASEIPPIRGIDNGEEDGVKAVVVAPNERDIAHRKIAYLERYSPELKRDPEEARATGRAPLISREAAQGLRFVRRITDTQWFPTISPEGQRIVSEWTTPGPDGVSAVVCSP